MALITSIIVCSARVRASSVSLRRLAARAGVSATEAIREELGEDTGALEEGIVEPGDVVDAPFEGNKAEDGRGHDEEIHGVDDGPRARQDVAHETGGTRDLGRGSNIGGPRRIPARTPRGNQPNSTVPAGGASKSPMKTRTTKAEKKKRKISSN